MLTHTVHIYIYGLTTVVRIKVKKAGRKFVHGKTKIRISTYIPQGGAYLDQNLADEVSLGVK